MTEGQGETPVDRGAAPRAARPWLKWALIASLAVNFLVVGAVVGHKGMGGRPGHSGYGRGGEEFGILGFARTLDGERRKELQRLIKSAKPDFKALREEVRAARRAAGEVLVAEPFDKEKLREALDGVVAASARLRGAGVPALLVATENMTPEERRALLEWWRERRPHHFR